MSQSCKAVCSLFRILGVFSRDFSFINAVACQEYLAKFSVGILEERNAWDKGSWFLNARGNPFQHSRDGLRRGNGAISMSPSSYSYHQEIFESCGTLASLLGTFHVSRCKNVTCSSILFEFRHTTLHHFSFILPSYFLSLSFGVPFMNDITFRRSLVDVRIIRQ